ncbi:hypothetical protein S40293_09615 [Stachybotrys chartarum IBT 40293]|nr:hypothetical protein S40293_09615 [Stachybotrys chartarum IBT 40293]KFA75329.1 hypothetical protein S40288_00142 [Stachybotrys chartarum IBT 40288]
MSPQQDQPAHLEPSELGTKQYWDSLYTSELSNHAHDPSDIGTVWFDDSDAEAKMVEFLAGIADDGDDEATVDSALRGTPLSKATTAFLDLGCGNGSLLLALRDDGWSGRLLGVDYSAQSIALADRVAAFRASEQTPDAAHLAPPVEFREWDVIAGPLDDLPPSPGWDVVLDKGTFDAISLSDERDARGRRLCEGYRDRVWQLARPGGGLFLVTSCNWTEAELRTWFEGSGGEDGAGFEVVGRVEYRSFSFGGHKGQTISTLCFRKP